ncbi:MAG TPA: hypothetical protein VIH99_04225 [Bdellovibrionota bacterium]
MQTGKSPHRKAGFWVLVVGFIALFFSLGMAHRRLSPLLSSQAKVAEDSLGQATSAPRR